MSLTREQIAEIVAAHAAGATQTQLAAEYDVSRTTIGRKLKAAENDKEMREVVHKKRAETLETFSECMDENTAKVRAFITQGLDRMLELLPETKMQSVATAIGILIDKWTALYTLMNDKTDNAGQLKDVLDAVRSVDDD